MDTETRHDPEQESWFCTERLIAIPFFVLAVVVVAAASFLWEYMLSK